MNLYHVTKFPPYFPFTLYCFYTKISSFMPVLTIGIVRDCFYLLIFYSEKFSTWVWRLPFAVIVNLSDKSQNQEILSTFSQPYPCVCYFRPFFGQISLPFHKLQLVKSPPFYIREAWKWYPFFGGVSLCGPLKGVRSPLSILRLEQVEFWFLFGLHYLLIRSHLFCLVCFQCPIEWFHYGCVGLTDAPKGKWFCPQCQNQMKQQRRGGRHKWAL